jgi:hypothetical protein
LLSVPTHGIQVAAEAGANQRISRAGCSTVAFVGRTLRGPLNRVVTVRSFDEYQAVFGGLWQPSTLSYAIDQFFDNGGVEARVVRVANGARSATIRLATEDGGWLVLEARCPGTREFLRASVDFDNIPASDRDAFNLVVQRVRSPGSEYVEDQEIYNRCSVNPESARNVTVMLADSALVRIRGPLPTHRPLCTERGDLKSFVAYQASSPDGDDGAPLTDYDVIGSATERAGLFAFGEQDLFNFLYIAPLSRSHQVGASALLVAARLCRQHNALLMIDPSDQWHTSMAALEGMRDSPYASEQAVMYFPWIEAYDRLKGRFDRFPPGGAALGMLGRLSRSAEPWAPLVIDDAPLRPGFRPLATVSEEQRTRLSAAGINVLQSVRPRQPSPARTLAASHASVPEWRYLGRRRLALQVIDSIVRGTRWVLFEPSVPGVWRRLVRQVSAFLTDYERDGAFPPAAPGGAWFVVCDERINPRGVQMISVLLGYGTGREGEWLCWLVTHDPAGTRVRHTSLNRLQSAGGRPPMDPDFDVATLLQEHFRI